MSCRFLCNYYVRVEGDHYNHLTLVSGSRRLITYRRLPDAKVSRAAVAEYEAQKQIKSIGTTVDDLNPFRRGYFRKFAPHE